MWVFCCQIFSSSVRGLLFTPRLWLSGVRSRGWGMLREGLGKKWGPTEGVRMEGMGFGLCVCVCVCRMGGGVYVWESVCAQQGKGATAEEGVVLWNYSYSLNAEWESFGQAETASHRKRMHRKHTHAYTQICSDNPGPYAVTPASAPARTAVRNPPR